MGNAPATGQPPPKSKGQGDQGQTKGKDGDDPWAETEGEKKAKVQKKKETDLIYDEKEDKYYDPMTGQVVVTPGKFEPEPAKRPLRVKVRKRQHYALRKRRKPPKPVPVAQSPDPPTPPKAIRPPTQYDADGYAMYFDEYGYPIEYDEDGHLIAPEPYYDEKNDEWQEPGFDEYGNLIVYDAWGIRVDNDENGDPVEYDRYGYPIEYDADGNPIERTYFPTYDEYGNEIPPRKKKEPKFDYPDDGYDYDDSIYTYTTLDSPIPPTPSPVSSDDVQDRGDSGDDLSMEDVTEFTWKPHQPVMPRDEARASIKTGGEDCSCFPKRSNPMIPSMVYDQVTCPHTNNVIGQAHASVVRFDDNWNDRYTRVHRPKRHERSRSKVTSVWGYPYKQFPDYKPGDETFEGGLRGEFQKPTSRPRDSRKVPSAQEKGSADGSQPKTTAAGLSKDDEKNPKLSKKQQKAKAKAEAKKKKKENDSKAGKKTTDDKAKDGVDDKKGTAAAGMKPDGTKAGDEKASKKDSKLANRNNATGKGKEEDEKPDTNGKAGEDAKKDESANKKDETKDQTQKSNSKQENKKPSSSEKNVDNKGDNAKQLSREKMNQPKIAADAKVPEPAKGKENDRAGNQSRTAVVAKNFLPKIGYTPDHPFSHATQRSPSPDTRREPEGLTLPPIPASPAYSIVSSVTARSQGFDHQPEAVKSRKFEGKYYDPVTKKTYTYEIKPRFGKNVQDWDALRQV